MAAIAATALLTIGLAALVRGRSALRETTLLPAWWWAALALVACSAVEIAAGTLRRDDSWLAPLRYAAAVLTFCPLLAVLGAKRPQHNAWNFVVLAFWGIVALPVAETFFLQRGQRLEIGDVRSWFLWPLILLGPINYVPTRNWLAALLVAAGQVLLLSEYLPLIHRSLFPGQQLVGLALLVAALLSTATLTRRASEESSAQGEAPRSRVGLVGANPYDRLWLDFRDTFGLFWALRLQERVHAVAETNDWPLDLAWSGLVEKSSGRPIVAIDPAHESALRTSLKGLLRRFVSGRWIAQRLGSDID